jgi:hypothetical protein
VRLEFLFDETSEDFVLGAEIVELAVFLVDRPELIRINQSL